MYQAWMFWNSKQHMTALVEFLTSQMYCTQANTTVLSQDQDNPRLEGATSVYRALRVLLRGQKSRFYTVVMKES